MAPGDGFPGHDEPVNIESDPEELFKTVLAGAGEENPDAVEPVLDE